VAGCCLARFIARFLQCTMNETVFGIHDGGFAILQGLFLHTLGCLITGCENFLGRFQMTYVFLGVLIILQQLDRKISGRVALTDGIICLQILLYFFISYMEDSGYMARAAFIMDKLMHKMGLHGKSFIPLIMGFGCNVPAVMATRTIESHRSRLVTMLILPLMSCSARLPIYIMVIGTFFAIQYRSLIMVSLYLIGIFLAVILSRIFASFVVKGEDTPFVMELPPYRFPTWKAIGRHTWEKGKQYLKKMGGIILVASIIVWALGYFPHNEELDTQAQQEQSYIGRIGKTIEPIFTPQGFDWKLDVGLVSGVGAKEIVASTMGVLYSNNDSFSDDQDYNDEDGKYEVLKKQMTSDLKKTYGYSDAEAAAKATLTAYCFLLFVLLYFPCIATIAAIKGETGSWKWAGFAAGYTTLLAWVVSALVFQIGCLFI
jgi:ferrous iron transport protein B